MKWFTVSILFITLGCNILLPAFAQTPNKKILSKQTEDEETAMENTNENEINAEIENNNGDIDKTETADADEKGQAIHEEKDVNLSDSDLQQPGYKELNENQMKELPDCATAEALRKALYENEGGIVTLTGDIDWSEEETDWLKVTEKTIIEMNGYTIHIGKNNIMGVYGPVMFTDKRTGNKPMISLSETGSFYGGDGTCFEAAGDNCVVIEMDQTANFNTDSISVTGNGCTAILYKGIHGEEAFSAIKAELVVSGADAVGIQAEGDIILRQIKVTAEGPNSTGVAAEGDVYFFLSYVQASGTPVKTEGEIVYDACSVLPVQEDALYVNRIVREADEGKIITAILKGEPVQMPPYIPVVMETEDITYSGKFESLVNSVFRDEIEVVWDTTSVDNEKEGVYIITASPVGYGNIPALLFRSMIGQVEIIGEKPAIKDVFYLHQNLVLTFHSQLPNANKVNVWYSLDEGSTWNVYPDILKGDRNESIEMVQFAKLFYEAQPKKGMIYVELINSNQSIITDTVIFSKTPPAHDGGGDRDSGDLGDQGELPPSRQEGNSGSYGRLNQEAMENNAFIQNIKETFQKYLAHWKESTEVYQGIDTVTNGEHVEQQPDSELNMLIDGEKKPQSNTIASMEKQTPAEERPEINKENRNPLKETDAFTETTDKSGEEEKDNLIKDAEAEQNIKEGIENIKENISSISLSGKEIRQMAQVNAETLTFIQKEIKVILDKKALVELNLADEEYFTADFGMEGQKQFYMKFFSKGEEMKHWNGNPIQIYIPYPLSNIDEAGEISCIGEAGIQLKAEGYEKEKLIFSLTDPGIYTIIEEKPVAAAVKAEALSENKLPWMTIIAGMLVLAAIGFALCNMLRKGQ